MGKVQCISLKAKNEMWNILEKSINNINTPLDKKIYDEYYKLKNELKNKNKSKKDNETLQKQNNLSYKKQMERFCKWYDMSHPNQLDSRKSKTAEDFRIKKLQKNYINPDNLKDIDPINSLRNRVLFLTKKGEKNNNSKRLCFNMNSTSKEKNNLENNINSNSLNNSGSGIGTPSVNHCNNGNNYITSCQVKNNNLNNNDINANNNIGINIINSGKNKNNLITNNIPKPVRNMNNPVKVIMKNLIGNSNNNLDTKNKSVNNSSSKDGATYPLSENRISLNRDFQYNTDDYLNKISSKFSENNNIVKNNSNSRDIIINNRFINDADVDSQYVSPNKFDDKKLKQVKFSEKNFYSSEKAITPRNEFLEMENNHYNTNRENSEEKKSLGNKDFLSSFAHSDRNHSSFDYENISEINVFHKEHIIELELRKFYNFKKKKFKERVFKGPPQSFRWISWMISANLPEKRNYDLYNYLKESEIEDKIDVQIKKDLHRTLSDFSQFNLLDTQNVLYNILRALAANDKEVGYCQGMNFIAGFLLIMSDFNELDTFYILISLMSSTFTNEFGIRGFFSEGFPLLTLYVNIFHLLFEKKMPDLKKHFEKLEIPDEVWISKWFQTLFTLSLPIEFCRRIWDCFLSEGLVFILSFTLSFLKFIENELFALQDLFEVIEFFKKLTPFYLVENEGNPKAIASSLNLINKIDLEMIIRNARKYSIPKSFILTQIENQEKKIISSINTKNSNKHLKNILSILNVKYELFLNNNIIFEECLSPTYTLNSFTIPFTKKLTNKVIENEEYADINIKRLNTNRNSNGKDNRGMIINTNSDNADLRTHDSTDYNNKSNNIHNNNLLITKELKENEKFMIKFTDSIINQSGSQSSLNNAYLNENVRNETSIINNSNNNKINNVSRLFSNMKSDNVNISNCNVSSNSPPIYKKMASKIPDSEKFFPSIAVQNTPSFHDKKNYFTINKNLLTSRFELNHNKNINHNIFEANEPKNIIPNNKNNNGILEKNNTCFFRENNEEDYKNLYDLSILNKIEKLNTRKNATGGETTLNNIPNDVNDWGSDPIIVDDSMAYKCNSIDHENSSDSENNTTIGKKIISYTFNTKIRNNSLDRKTNNSTSNKDNK